MIENDVILLVIIFCILYILLLIINYKAFTKYPSRLTELWLGHSILETKGPRFFIIIKSILFLVAFMILLALTLFIPTCYSYLFLGILLGVVCFNLIHDYATYKRAEKSEQKG